MNKKSLIKYSHIDYKNSIFLKSYINIDGRILPKFVTTLSPKEQRKLSRSIKSARIMGLLRFLNN